MTTYRSRKLAKLVAQSDELIREREELAVEKKTRVNTHKKAQLKKVNYLLQLMVLFSASLSLF